ncbi:MAG: glycoside hydrolase/phage tail family protein [Rhodobacteraceae bacterium]|nr:glycoside hydrolase/phage tail family protein [Paracoccaceae bacterium]
MATLLLSAAGAALGGSVGGSLLGVSAAAIGRAVGATVGRAIDQSLLGEGSDAVETGRVDRFRLTGASEGAPVTQLYGRMRIGGQVIWATEFQELSTTTGGGKGAPSSGPATTTYSYTVSLAIALCEGEISGVGRVWADGQEVSPETLNMRVYPGDSEQQPDPKIAAVQGIENTPAFRGTAYVVMEDLDLSPFGSRVPQFSFEVTRPSQTGSVEEPRDMSDAVQAVAMMPGSGEYALATTPVTYDAGYGRVASANVNTASSKTDFSISVRTLGEQLPNCQSTSLIVSWFGDDLRCGQCTLTPRVERQESDGASMAWSVAGIDRANAQTVPADGEGRPLYGGTPTDQSVTEAIQELRASGQEVMFYPFILMTQAEGNTLPNPYSGTAGQPLLPWRGRITLDLAPGVAGTTDQTAAAEAEVAAFMGDAQSSDFSVNGQTVSYTGPADTGYRRFILHYAHLCAAAGGVDSFCIGSEMRGLTQIRGAGNSFPAVEALQILASDCRSILGPDCEISYAADWSEYFGYQPQDGTGDVFYHLDPLWADPEIDFIGIDNYMPLSDWRDGRDHLDAFWVSPYSLEYLKANVAGGEGYDWYYASQEDRDAQVRTPITDGAHNEPWVFRVKDIQGWWENHHHNRVGGQRDQFPTVWEPGQKPVRFTEYGCAAVDKGTNQPNKFLDPKSSESSLPYYSNGLRDPLVQLQYLRAMAAYWNDPDNNPVSEVYEAPMVDMGHAHVWAWDVRPYPAFPALNGVWSDGENYGRGHWITGRATGRSLADVVQEICARSGVTDIDVTRLFGFVRGYVVEDVTDARAALQPLMLAYGFDVVERNGKLVFFNRDGVPTASLTEDGLVYRGGEEPVLGLERAAYAELTGRVQLTFLDADADYETAAVDALYPGDNAATLTVSEIPLALTRSEARAIAERWLSETRLARDKAQFVLPPSKTYLGAGDVVSLPEEGGEASYRIDRVEDTEARLVSAVRVDAGTYERPSDLEDEIVVTEFVPPLPVFAQFMDLPLLSGDEVPHAPHLAVTGEKWPGAAAVYSSASGAGFSLLALLTAPATLGEILEDVPTGPCGVRDRATKLRVRLTRGTLSSITEEALLAGGNLAAIGDGSADNWEIIQFQNANLVAEDTYELSVLLRGQAGSDALMPAIWAAGGLFVLLDGAVEQLELASSTRDVEQTYRIGTSGRPFDDPSYGEQVLAFSGVGLRPLSPVHLKVETEGSDLAVSWIRRTREDGDPWGEGDVPLGEAVESYRVRAVRGNTVLREEYVSTSTWTYTAAARAADGLAPGDQLRVAQVSEKVGSGAEAIFDFS